MLRKFAYKQFGSLSFTHAVCTGEVLEAFKGHIKILFLPKSSQVFIDFNEFKLEEDSLLFVNPAVVIKPYDDEDTGKHLLHFNRDFYCVEIHDHEVACDGILYNNVFEIPFVSLNEMQSEVIQNLIAEIKGEMEDEDSNTEEMLRILLKMIILKSTRIWKQQHQLTDADHQVDIQFLRKFSKLVEENYKTHHSVADYAEMLYLTPKSLSKKISLLSKDTPNDIIKNRIILESKRLLVYTNLSVKEVAHTLNYDDDAYFVRFFTNRTGISPLSFRKTF